MGSELRSGFRYAKLPLIEIGGEARRLVLEVTNRAPPLLRSALRPAEVIGDPTVISRIDERLGKDLLRASRILSLRQCDANRVGTVIEEPAHLIVHPPRCACVPRAEGPRARCSVRDTPRASSRSHGSNESPIRPRRCGGCADRSRPDWEAGETIRKALEIAG